MFFVNAQNITISGIADSMYQGKIIRLMLYTNYITNSVVEESTDTISNEGKFQLHSHINSTQPIYLQIENVKAQLYAEPGKDYLIKFPKAESPEHFKSDVEVFVRPSIYNDDNTELNNLIFDYEELYNKFFLRDDGKFLSRGMIFKLIDSCQMESNKKFAESKNDYFKNYIKYSLATDNANVSRGESFLANAYIKSTPILYHHFEYMKFFNAYFKGFLLTISSQKKGETIYKIINEKASFELLNEFASKHWLLKSDTLREFVLLNNLWEFYFNPEFNKESVKNIVNQIAAKSKIKEHQSIILAMQSYFNQMMIGSKAPDFSARTADGKIGTLSLFKGKWLYINFFSSNNIESLKEMPKILELKKKYGHKISFLSICLDDSLKAYQNYLRTNKKFDWPIWFNNEKSLSTTAKQKYFVAGDEAYFLISNLGLLALSPALSPSGGIEYRFNLLFKVKRKDFKIGIR